ncbi:aconitate hydratase AcnA [Marinomonas rhizomae]|uniref:aconitate hydratase AcnA n=1 Tax=Marinomonas rhizomae TaxID=491948 RepID=UPI002106355E|nr:aconitate hydratase AcnA [Marinomonas rhizomae]UTV98422.1 aconitate hydratase AcnA [Marinomonas rhizomae]
MSDLAVSVSDKLITNITVANKKYSVVNPRAAFGDVVDRLPVVLRLLLENLCRNASEDELKEGACAIIGWLEKHTSHAEIPFQPGRVLMHDTTSTPALVDIAAMRDTLREKGVPPTSLTPLLHVDVSIDHSLAVEAFAEQDAANTNMAHEIRRNSERYRFLRWAAKALGNVTIHPPGTGIMHTINLEQLATVVYEEEIDGRDFLVPDMMLGTDSHTPMINGIGVLGWGVGGLEAQTVMFGMPTMLRIPDVVGVKLTGELAPGIQASDLALTVTNRLRAIGVTGEFVEFFGPGVKTLSADSRAVVANMAPEYGATTGYFPVDENTLTYLKNTGRSDEQLALIESYMKEVGLWFDENANPEYSRLLEINLSQIGLHAAGPRRPQDILTLDQIPSALRNIEPSPKGTSGELPVFPVAVAAITSCTNTSSPALLVAAGLLAKKAVLLGLSIPDWIKTSLAPGSPAAVSYLKRAGLLEALEILGFGVVGFGCTTCIGNSGPLTSKISTALEREEIRPVAFLSGNRNFPGRIHPDVDLGFIMSPPMVIAAALAGNAEIDLANSPLQYSKTGEAVYLKDLWPSHDEVNAALAKGLQTIDFKNDFDIASKNPLWMSLVAPESDCFPWAEESTILRRPPFASCDEGTLLGDFTAYPLLVVGDDVTTDHISPASAIPKDSLVADFLVERGDDRNDLNVFASRRGNWEVMMRAAFHSKTLVNLLVPDVPVAHTLHVPSNTVAPISDVADQYRAAGDSVVILAGERYGMGSSRDWAAKGQRLLGVRAVIAVSFERIHRSNLIGMGILPLCFPVGVSSASLSIQPGDQIQVNADHKMLSCRGAVEVKIIRANAADELIVATAAIETQLELELLRVGGVLPLILKRTIENN